MATKRETYPVAKERLLTELAAMGWSVARTYAGRALKVPHATSPDGIRFDFTAQAIHLHGGTSTFLDMRESVGADLVSWARNLVRYRASYAHRTNGGAE